MIGGEVKKALVIYYTNSGSTSDVASAIAEELTQKGVETTTKQLAEIQDLSSYDAVVLGAPMIVGWHRDALKYLKTHRNEFDQKPLALFLTGMSLTESPAPESLKAQLHVDARLAVAPKNPQRLSFKERFATLKNYLAPILKEAPDSLAAIGVFGGRLDFRHLKWYEVLFVMLVVGVKPGEKRNYADIRGWSAGLPALLNLEN